jgi:hypothetical protein
MNDYKNKRPAPWRHEGNGAVVDADGFYVCTVYPLAQEETLPKIVAAPEGYEAVHKFLADLDAVKVGAGERFHLTRAHVDAFRAFVAKAEGKD